MGQVYGVCIGYFLCSALLIHHPSSHPSRCTKRGLEFAGKIIHDSLARSTWCENIMSGHSLTQKCLIDISFNTYLWFIHVSYHGTPVLFQQYNFRIKDYVGNRFPPLSLAGGLYSLRTPLWPTTGPITYGIILPLNSFQGGLSRLPWRCWCLFLYRGSGGALRNTGTGTIILCEKAPLEGGKAVECGSSIRIPGFFSDGFKVGLVSRVNTNISWILWGLFTFPSVCIMQLRRNSASLAVEGIINLYLWFYRWEMTCNCNWSIECTYVPTLYNSNTGRINVYPISCYSNAAGVRHGSIRPTSHTSHTVETWYFHLALDIGFLETPPWRRRVERERLEPGPHIVCPTFRYIHTLT